MKPLIIWFWLLFSLALGAQSFVPASASCAMAHCNVRISSFVRAPIPTSPNVSILSHDALPAGKGVGLGCSSNQKIAACSYQDPSGNNLVIYTPQGARVWGSGALLDDSAFASAPMINATGDVIAADDTNVVRVTNKGAVVWETATPGGTPISPVETQSGGIVLATKGGPVSVYNNASGALLGSAYFRPSAGSSSYYETSNTPCVIGNRIYISTQLSSDAGTGALLAVDVDISNAASPLTLAWQFTFGGPSGASPACLGNNIYFDGSSLNPDGPLQPVVFGVQDLGSAPALLWSQLVPASVPAALTPDPRGGGLWCIYLNTPVIQRRSAATGAVTASMNIAQMVGDPLPNNPYSEINIGGSMTAPVMLLGTTSQMQTFYGKGPPPTTPFSSYVIAIDLNSASLLWKINLSPSLGSDGAASQFAAITDASGITEVVFAGNTSGAYFVGVP